MKEESIDVKKVSSQLLAVSYQCNLGYYRNEYAFIIWTPYESWMHPGHDFTPIINVTWKENKMFPNCWT